MAGDWIPFLKNLPRKPEVLRLMRLTGLTREAVVCSLLEFWAWVDDETVDGRLEGLTLDDLAAICPTCAGKVSGFVPVAHRNKTGNESEIIPNFFRALSEVGWLNVSDTGISIPHFDRWMARPAKERLIDSRRKRNNTQSRRAIPNSFRSNSGARPEKNRTTGQDNTVGGLDPPITPCTPALAKPTAVAAPSPNPSCGNDPPTEAATPSGCEPLALLVFPCAGKHPHWELSREQVQAWERLYPGIDVLAECRKALAWIEANPTRSKTRQGMPRFLVNWLNKATDHRRGGSAPPVRHGRPTAEETLRRIEERERQEAERKQAGGS